jgi:PAS domain S-box-containing protein
MDTPSHQGPRTPRPAVRPRAPGPLATLAEHLPDVIARFDRRLRHLYVNRAVAAYTGLPPEAFLGKTDRELGFPDHLVALWEGSLARAFTSGQLGEMAFTFPSPDGECYFESRLVPEPGRGRRVASVVVVTRDVTERKRLEAELRRARGGGEAGFTGPLAGDLTNRLAVILQFSELALGQVPAGRSAHADLVEVRLAAGQAVELAQRLLTAGQSHPGLPAEHSPAR